MKTKLLKPKLRTACKVRNTKISVQKDWRDVIPNDKGRFNKGRIITERKELEEFAKLLDKQKEFSIDTEADADDFHVCGPNKKVVVCDITISWGDDNNYDLPFNHYFDGDDQLKEEWIRELLGPIIAKKDIKLIFHNAKFDMHVLKRIGISVKTKDIVDTAIMSFLIDENEPNGLKENMHKYFGIAPQKFKEATSTVSAEDKKALGLKANAKATFPMVRIKDGANYCMDDAYNTYVLGTRVFPVLMDQEGMTDIYWNMYVPAIHTVFEMEEEGIDLDWNMLPVVLNDIQKDIDEYTYNLLELAGVAGDAKGKPLNLNSSQQKAELLFGYNKSKNPNWGIITHSFGLKPISFSETGVPQSGFDILCELAKLEYKDKRKREGVEFCRQLRDYTKLTRLKSFIEGFEKHAYDDGKIHCSLNIIGAASGRFSCSNPNMQQLPNSHEEDEELKYTKYKIRDLIIGRPMKNGEGREDIISVDYSNLEVRVMAHYSKDTGLLNAFKHGLDLHGNTACLMFKLPCEPNEVKKLYPVLRQMGKVIAFLIQYGGGASTLKDNFKGLGIDLEEYVKTSKDIMNGEYSKKEAKEIMKERNWTKDDVKEAASCKDRKKGKRVVSAGTELAQKYIDKYFEAFSGIADYMKRIKKYAHRNEAVYTLVKRKRRLPEINGDNYGNVGYCERLALNAPIQGSGADIIVNAQNRISGQTPCFVTKFYVEAEEKIRAEKGLQSLVNNSYDASDELGVEVREDGRFRPSERLKELGCTMILQVHDELLFSCPPENCDEAIRIIRDCMIYPFGAKVELNQPLEVGAGHGPSYGCGH